MKNLSLLFVIYLLTSCNLKSQVVYKTPSGEKYHLASCRMVENVSKKIVDPKITKLTPCSFCKPPIKNKLISNLSTSDKSSGRKPITSQCKGIAKSTGKRCKHMTSIGNGYCYQHSNQKKSIAGPKSSRLNYSSPPRSSHTSKCGARTKSGKSCKRKVKGGGRCYQHKG